MMAFDLNKFWAHAFGGPQNATSSTPVPAKSATLAPVQRSSQPQRYPTPKAGKVVTPVRVQSVPRTTRRELEDDEEEDSEEESKSRHKSDASKDLDSDATMLDVHSQILQVSHKSVLLRPHPPPPRKRYHPVLVTGHENLVAPHRKGTSLPAAESMFIPAPELPRPVPPCPKTLKATKVIRGKPKKLPWYKRLTRRNRDKSRDSSTSKSHKTEPFKTEKIEKKKPDPATKKKPSLWKRIKTQSRQRKKDAGKKTTATNAASKKKTQRAKSSPKKETASRKSKKRKCRSDKCKQQ